MLPLIIVKKGVRSRRQTCMQHCELDPVYIHDTTPVVIEDIRLLSRQVALAGTNAASYYVIVHAHTLTLPSQHALLKTLEESPANTCIVLGVPRLHTLIPTIISRCQVVIPAAKHTGSAHHDASLLTEIISSSYGQLIQLAQNHDKKQSQHIIRQLINIIRQGLQQHPTQKRAQVIHLLTQSLRDLDTNVNPSLILEHLYFQIKSTLSLHSNPRG